MVNYEIHNKGSAGKALLSNSGILLGILFALFLVGLVVFMSFAHWIALIFLVGVAPIAIPYLFLLESFTDWENSFQAEWGEDGVLINDEKGGRKNVRWDEIERVAVEECGLVEDVDEGGVPYTLQTLKRYSRLVSSNTLQAIIWLAKSGRSYGEELMFVHFEMSDSEWISVPLPVSKLESAMKLIKENVRKEALDKPRNIFSKTTRSIIGTASFFILSVMYVVESMIKNREMSPVSMGIVVLGFMILIGVGGSYFGWYGISRRRLPFLQFTLLGKPAKVYGASVIILGLSFLALAYWAIPGLI